MNRSYVALLVMLVAAAFEVAGDALIRKGLVVSVCTGRFVFREAVSATTWLGLAVILVGSMIIHVGSTAP